MESATSTGPYSAGLLLNPRQSSTVRTVDFLYSLYDALVSINVPNDKARAVVDAMERDMGTTLATKADLQILRGEFRQEITLVRKDLEILATSMTVRLGSILVVGLGLLFAALKLT
jgi:hypothetical protein